jgi:hypothetical protein
MFDYGSSDEEGGDEKEEPPKPLALQVALSIIRVHGVFSANE